MSWPAASYGRFARDQVRSAHARVGRAAGGVERAGDLSDLAGTHPDEPLPPGPATVLVTLLSAGLWLLITVGCVAMVR